MFCLVRSVLGGVLHREVCAGGHRRLVITQRVVAWVLVGWLSHAKVAQG